MKKLVSLMLVAAMAVSMTACGSEGDTSDGTGTAPASTEDGAESSNEGEGTATAAGGYMKDTIKVALSADGGTLDPNAGFVNWGSATMTGLIYQHLIDNDYDYNNYYNIAKSITPVDGEEKTALAWEVEIWDCVFDTNGNQITIDDVIGCYDDLIAAGNAGAIPKFDSWEKVDDYHAIMHLNEAFGDGDFAKHFGNANIYDQDSYDAAGRDFTQEPVGCGPYMLESYTVNSEVVLTANEDFWMIGNVDWQNPDSEYYNPTLAQNFKTIKYEIIQDASSRAIALEMGDVDAADSLDMIDVDSLVEKGFNTIDMQVRPPVGFVLNANEESVLSNLALRQAILYGLDNDAISEAISYPTGPAYGIQPGAADAPDSWTTGRDYYTFDADKAKELLEEAGYNGETITVMYTSGQGAADTAAIMIQSQLREIGVEVELLSLDLTTAMDYTYDPTGWDIRIATMGGGAYLSQVLKMWWKEDISQLVPEGSGWNSSLVADPELDELYVALKNDNSSENIDAWAEYFDSQAYGYAICTYSTPTCCASDLEAVVAVGQGFNPALLVVK